MKWVYLMLLASYLAMGMSEFCAKCVASQGSGYTPPEGACLK